jgi:hypothetical protein
MPAMPRLLTSRWPGLLLALLVPLAATGCATGDDPADPADPHGPDEDPPAHGGRTLALDVNEAAGVPYWEALQAALELGVQDVKQSYDWDATLAGFGAEDWSAVANATFAQVDCQVTLVLRPLDTTGPTYPAGVPRQPLDHAEAVAAFAAFVDSLWVRMPDLRARDQIGAILVGNEIDGPLGRDPGLWAQWGRFLGAARGHILSRDWGAQPPLVGSILTFAGATDPRVRALSADHVLPHCDQVAVTYYPLASDFTMRPPGDVAGDLTRLAGLFPDHALRLQECGYASGSGAGSSPADQAAFVDAVFTAWDDLAARIVHVDFTWQHDVSDATADAWVTAYGMEGHLHEAAFRSYLRTLGLHHHDGAAKPAWQRLADAAATRGW